MMIVVQCHISTRKADMPSKMSDRFTLRMLGNNFDLTRAQWLELLEAMIPTSSLAIRITRLLDESD